MLINMFSKNGSEILNIRLKTYDSESESESEVVRKNVTNLPKTKNKWEPKTPKQKTKPKINRKTKKSGFRIGAHVDIGMKDFEAGMTFGKNHVTEMHYSENNQHLKLIKSMEKEDDDEKQKDKIINTLLVKNIKNDDDKN